MRDDAVDGEELMILRLPRPLPEPCARRIAESPNMTSRDNTVYRSWVSPLRGVERSGRAITRHKEQGELPEIGIDYGFFGVRT